MFLYVYFFDKSFYKIYLSLYVLFLFGGGGGGKKIFFFLRS